MVILNNPFSYNKKHREKAVNSFAGWKNTGLPLLLFFPLTGWTLNHGLKYFKEHKNLTALCAYALY
jgi:hypothetical protein